jgi:hypothetical protein
MALVEYHPVYHWEKDIEIKGGDKKKAHIRVFDTQEDREIKKLDYSMHDENKIGSMYALPFSLSPPLLAALHSSPLALTTTTHASRRITPGCSTR